MRRLRVRHVHVQDHWRSGTRPAEHRLGVPRAVMKAIQAKRRARTSVRQKGQALVEFALIAPVLIGFVLLTVDIGRAYWESIDAAGASRAGARMGSISDTADI